MTPSPTSATVTEASARDQLLSTRSGLILCQSLYAVCELGIPDLVADNVTHIRDLALRTSTLPDPLLRVLRLLASQDIFVETAPGTFAHTPASELLRSDAPCSMRPLFRFWGSDFWFPCFGQILSSLRTGEQARKQLSGMDGFSYLRQHPDLARIFDEAMTVNARDIACQVTAAYDFSRWDSLMDVGGGNGMLLAHILRISPGLRGVLADQPHVLERARERGFLSGDIASRVSFAPCDFFAHIPSGCRACLMSRVIHDWADAEAIQILTQCRRAVPADGALLLVETRLEEENRPSQGRFMDIIMLVITGGRERTIAEYSELLAASGFCLHQVYPAGPQYMLLEALPV